MALEKIMKVVESFHHPPLSGRLALHIACRKGKTSLIAVLVDKNPNAVCVHDSRHKLPIHYASALQPLLPPIVLRQIVHTWPESCYQKEEEYDSDTYNSTNVFTRDPDDPSDDSEYSIWCGSQATYNCTTNDVIFISSL